MYGNNFSPNRFGRLPQFSPNDQRFHSPMGGPPRFQHGSPSPQTQFHPRFMGPPPDRGGQDFRGRSPRYHHQRRGFNSPPYPHPGPDNSSTPSPHNRSYGNNDGWNNHQGNQKTPYRGGRGHHRGSQYNPGSSSRIEDYFSPDMLEDPWAELTQKPPSPKQQEESKSTPLHQSS